MTDRLLYVFGPTRYTHIPLTSGRELHLFGDFHDKKARCPSDRRMISLPDFLDTIFMTNPRKFFHVLLEKHPGDGKGDERGYIDSVFNRFHQSVLPNVSLTPVDIRVRGIQKELTRVIKAYGYAVRFASYLDQTDEKTFEGLKYRFREIVRRVNVDADRLFRNLSITDETITSFFRPLITRMRLRGNERSAYLNIIDTLDHSSPSFTHLIVDKNRIFRSMRNYFLQMGSLIVDLYTVDVIMKMPPATQIVVYMGTEHYRRLVGFFRHTATHRELEADDELAATRFQCLPAERIMTDLQGRAYMSETKRRRTL